jgi:S1-C subfamily serine protease
VQKKSEIIHPARSFRRLASVAALLLALAAGLGFAQDAEPRPPSDGSLPHGALVDEVTAGGPAAKAGISAHDVITEIEGTELRSVNQIIEALMRHKPGDDMKLTVVKASDGTRAEVTLTLGTNPRDQSVPYMGLFVTSWVRLPPPQAPTLPGNRPSPAI